MQNFETKINDFIIETYCGRLNNQCITKKYFIKDIDKEGWVNPSKVQIIDKINLPNHCIYTTELFLESRHNEIINTIKNAKLQLL